MKTELKIEHFFVLILVVLGLYYMYLASTTQMLGEDETVYTFFGKKFSESIFPIFGATGRPVIPPKFIPLVYSFFFLIFGYSLSLAKVIVAFFGLLTVLMVYLIGKKLNIYYGFFSAVLLLSIPTFTHHIMIAYIEVPIAFFSAFFTYLLLSFKANEKNLLFKAVIIGIILGLAFYTKQSALILAFVLFLYSLGLFYYSKNKKYLKLFFISIITFSIILLPFIIKNLIHYGYPFFEGLNYFFKRPAYMAGVQWVTDAVKLISPTTISLNLFFSTFGLLTLILTIFGLGWLISNFKFKLDETKFLITLVLPFIIFITIFTLFNLTGYAATESRYLSIIFPQAALLGGFFLWKIKEKTKYSLFVLILIVVFALYSSVDVAQSTSNSVRYPSDYVQALKWLKGNSTEDSLVFTTYGGSVRHYADREIVWVIEEFPEVMRTANGTFIHDTLKKYNVSYILIWRNVLAQDYIIPQANLIGVFTYNFLDVVSNDRENFDTFFQNQNNVIFKLK